MTVSEMSDEAGIATLQAGYHEAAALVNVHPGKRCATQRTGAHR
jgi:hypothetical protein